MLKGSDLPPIRSLRTFVVVAHHQSFSKAAEELCVTQSAVSKQIASLEQLVEQPLIERHNTGIILTEQGKLYLPKIMEALEAIEYATASLRQTNAGKESLVVCAPPSFVSLWLLIKAEQFQTLNPDIELQFVTHEVSGERVTNEIEIRCLPLANCYEHSQLLLEEQLVLISKHPTAHHELESMFQTQKIIPHTTRPHLWQRYAESMQVKTPFNYHSIGYEHFYLALEAVRRDMGIALVPSFLAAESLERGDIYTAEGQSYLSGYGYYLSVPNHRRSSRKVALFCQWLKDELS